MVEDVIVWILAGFVALLIGRRFHRALTGKSGSCGCGSAGCQQAGARAQIPCGNADRDERRHRS